MLSINRLAISGSRGEGRLLCGFYQQTSGTITVDGTPLTELDPAAWRERVTSAFQDFSRFPFLAREAVGVGNLPRIDEFAEAAEKGGAAQVFARLPEGEEPRLGKALGDGVELSGGQPRWTRPASTRSTSDTRRQPASGSTPPAGSPCWSRTDSPPSGWPT
ncbi:ATP-binding cassette domain-containing protein [Nonomuraea sp. H19]|uniref:ATP-binding cassette domain-containing protein n=1 Tax=Nonomuraea sp. H19 TaxID=3452206 RepID=UPI003F8A7A17